MLQNQQSESDVNQANSVNKIIMQLQQLQRTQMELLHGNDPISPRPQSVDAGLFQHNALNKAVQSQSYRMPGDVRSTLSNMSYPKSANLHSQQMGHQGLSF